MRERFFESIFTFISFWYFRKNFGINLQLFNILVVKTREMSFNDKEKDFFSRAFITTGVTIFSETKRVAIFDKFCVSVIKACNTKELFLRQNV